MSFRARVNKLIFFWQGQPLRVKLAASSKQFSIKKPKVLNQFMNSNTFLHYDVIQT